MRRSELALTAILATVMPVAIVTRYQSVNAASSFSQRRSDINSSQSLAIIINRSNLVNNLSFPELRKIFLGDRLHWSNGHRVAIAMLGDGQPERQTVLRLIYRMDEDTYQEHLLRGMFRGDVFIAPRTLSSPTMVRKFVFNAPGGIGYVRASDVDDTVKVVRIDGLLPEDPNYPLLIDEPPKNR